MNFFEKLGLSKNEKPVESMGVMAMITSVERAVELTKTDPEIQKLVQDWKILTLDPVGDDTQLIEKLENKLKEALTERGIKLEFIEKPYGIEGDDSISTFVMKFTD